jgi:tetratricopeptide (TPR) repeat protein
MLTKFMFRVLHVMFLLLALIMFFNLKFSPSLRLQDAPVGFLTFYYMGALCIGYYSGYILLVFGKNAGQGWENQSTITRAVNMVILGALWLLAIAAPCAALVQNYPGIKAARSTALADYSKEIVRDLPAKPGIILCDDPMRLCLLEAEYRREGKPNKNILIETGSMPYREYIAYLVSRYPELQKMTTPPEKLRHVLPPESLRSFIFSLSQKYSIYYLNPSFGYYFEAFYLKPHGLVYELQIYPHDALQAPLASEQDIKANQQIWDRLKKSSLSAFPSLAKLDPDADKISINYSLALDFWGVALQKANHLAEAGIQFAEAVRINPKNFIARINKQYNEQLQKNNRRPIDSGDFIYKAVSLYHSFVPILKFNGPVDEPDMNLEFGRLMADGHDLRQAAGMFERRLQLLPNDVPAELDLAKVFVDLGAPDKAIELVHKLRADPSASKWDVARVEALAYYAKNDFPTAEKLMQNALKESPADESRVAILAEFYRVTAYTALKEMNASTNAAVRTKFGTEATRRFNNALSYLDHEAQLLTQASRNASNPYGVIEVLLKKAEVEMMLKSFKAAIVTLNKILDLQPGNATAVLNRAVAEIQLAQYQAAKDDFRSLRKLVPTQRYMADYGLADVANREGNTAEEIRCLKRYLDIAPDDIPDYQQIKQRLRRLESH